MPGNATRRLFLAVFGSASASVAASATNAPPAATLVESGVSLTAEAGLFVTREQRQLPSGTEFIRTAGHHAPGKGAATYARDQDQSSGAESEVRAKWNGVWFSLVEVEPNPYMFGAVGDDYTDDTRAVQAMVDACPAGGKVTFPQAGRFRLQDAIRLPRPIKVQGASSGSYVNDAGGYVRQANPEKACFLLVASLANYAFDAYGVLDVQFSDMAIIGASRSHPSLCAIGVDISVNNGDFHVRECNFSNLNIRYFKTGYDLEGIVYLNRWYAGCVTDCEVGVKISRGRASDLGGQNRFFSWTACDNTFACASLNEDTFGGTFAFFGCTMAEAPYGIRANEKVQLTVLGSDFEAFTHAGNGAAIYIPIVQANPNSEGPKLLEGNKFLLSDNDIWLDKTSAAFAGGSFHWPMVIDGNYFGSKTALKITLPTGHSPLKSPAFVFGASNSGLNDGRVGDQQLSSNFAGTDLRHGQQYTGKAKEAGHPILYQGSSAGEAVLASFSLFEGDMVTLEGLLAYSMDPSSGVRCSLQIYLKDADSQIHTFQDSESREPFWINATGAIQVVRLMINAGDRPCYTRADVVVRRQA